jgi:hypothetical protein
VSLVAAEALGEAERARALASKIVELARTMAPAEATVHLCFWLLGARACHGLEDALRPIVEGAPAGRWKDIAVAGIEHEFSRAADLCVESGSLTWEASYRERSATELIATGRRREAEAELDRALGFYRTAGARFYIDRCEALLRQPKSA